VTDPRAPRGVDDASPNTPDAEPEEKRAELEGREPLAYQDGAIDADELEAPAEPTDTERYELDEMSEDEVVAMLDAIRDGLGSLDLRDGETDDPNVAAEEGLAWVPPVDPPVVPDPDEDEGIAVAAGFGSTAFDEPFDADHHSDELTDEDEVTARVREALRADARTSALADRVALDSEDGVVWLRGSVSDLDDVDQLVEVASEVDGVTDVRDELEVTSV